jgi:aspartyl-tRNA(Asn)/glutamyl-tRNA(Gln) amidotransferase subunit A
MVMRSPELYQSNTLDRLRSCAGISASDYIRNVRSLAAVEKQARELCRGVDALLTPAVHIIAPKLAQLQSMEAVALRQFETRWLLRNTIPFSALCWPSVSVPCGFTPDGLPVGLQISAPPGRDNVVLRLAHAYEQATDWHKRRPATG